MRQILRHNQPVIAHQRLARRAHSLLAVRREWQLCRAGVSAVERPFCFAMTNDEDAGCGHCNTMYRGVEIDK